MPPHSAPVRPRPPELSARLAAALAAKGPGWRPRTHLLDGGAPRYLNRLILEVSPYLGQHAHNPVDWHPWGPEALATAAALDRPIFLSVGYATCHWCHVMEEESFDDEEVAAQLNAGFVPVKLDREVRPDLDHLFITATQLQQGHAGWPNSLFLLPDGRPFHTGTYFPRPQFQTLLAAVTRAWGAQRGQIVAAADALGAAIARQSHVGRAVALDPGIYDAAAAQLAVMANRAMGGFSTTQQFPQEGFILYALDHWRRGGADEALAVARAALDAIAAGGIHDHVGGGFHRYCVDANWRTPHFEKMLYNQGQLGRAFVEAWEATGEPAYARAARRCFDYVLRDMTDAGGAFYAAEDADSLDAHGRLEEGAFYAWTPAQAPEAAVLLGLDQIPTLEAGAVAHLRPGVAQDWAALDALLAPMLVRRDARPRPLRDDKVIAGWNGLMIRALAQGAAAFGAPDLAAAAGRAATAVWDRLWSDGRLSRLWADGRAHEDGVLEDYAWVGLGYLALWDATGAGLWLERAAALGAAARARFGDASGRLRMAEADGPLGPIHDAADGATPAGESAALELFARLAARGHAEFSAAARDLLAALSGPLAEAPLLRPDALVAARILAGGESGATRVLADGALRARLDRGGQALVLDLAPGWHLAAGGDLAAPQITGAAAVWPEGVLRHLGFADRPVPVHLGQVVVPLTPTGPELALQVQVCSDAMCLAPQTARFRLGTSGF